MKSKSIFKTEARKKAVFEAYDKQLQQWKIPYITENISTRFGKTHVIQFGNPNGPALILLHGTGSNSLMWAGEAETFGKNFNVYAVDIIGEPGKSAENRPNLEDKSHVHWLEDVINNLGLKTVNMVGYSLGAWLAVKLAIHTKIPIEKLVICSSSGIAQPKVSFIFKTLFFMLLGKVGYLKINKILLGEEAMDEEAEAFGYLIMKSFRFRLETIPIFTDEELKKLSMPIFYMAGEKDALLHTQKSVARLRRLLPSITTEVIQNGGHVIFGIGRRITEFLKETS